jgi:hypothetical protein
VAVTRETGERFDLSRAELEQQGFAANGSVWDLIFTLDGFEIAQAVAELERDALARFAERERKNAERKAQKGGV